MKDIFDKKTKKWYMVERGWRNSLRLTPIRYTNIIRCPTSDDLIFGE